MHTATNSRNKNSTTAVSLLGNQTRKPRLRRRRRRWQLRVGKMVEAGGPCPGARAVWTAVGLMQWARASSKSALNIMRRKLLWNPYVQLFNTKTFTKLSRKAVATAKATARTTTPGPGPVLGPASAAKAIATVTWWTCCGQGTAALATPPRPAQTGSGILHILMFSPLGASKATWAAQKPNLILFTFYDELWKWKD